MRTIGQITIAIRFQAIAVYVLVLAWHGLLWLNHQWGENLSVVLEVLYLLLPLLTTLLALIILESRIRHHQRCNWWVYPAVLAGLTPWIWYALFNLSI